MAHNPWPQGQEPSILPPMKRAMTLDDLKTPCLLLSRPAFVGNCRRMSERLRGLGVHLRPHMKTAKSADAARLATEGHFGGITVSTLAEADYFARSGFREITYAVGIVPTKLEEAAALQSPGVNITLLTDSTEVIPALETRAAALDAAFPLLIEVDTGGRRGGVAPDGEDLIVLGQRIHESPSLTLAGVLTHAGQSYHCPTVDGIREVAEQERAGITRAAERLRNAGLPCPVVSAGSTPTATHAANLSGVTEMRPGVYMFGDLDQMALGSCRAEDIAVTVLASVIGHNRRANRILIDAGGLALSKDVSASEFLSDVGYGRLCGEDGAPTRLFVSEVHQEHGLIAAPDGEGLPFDLHPIGSRVRILPNHICMTAAAHERYHVTDGKKNVLEVWERTNGW